MYHQSLAQKVEPALTSAVEDAKEAHANFLLMQYSTTVVPHGIMLTLHVVGHARMVPILR